MPDVEAVENPDSFVDNEEMADAQSPHCGAGTPETAPEVVPRVTFWERLRLLWS